MTFYFHIKLDGGTADKVVIPHHLLSAISFLK